MLNALHNSLLSIIYPQNCLVCSREVERSSDGCACRECWAATRIFIGEATLCEKCGAFLRNEVANASVFCHNCDEHHYDKAVAAGAYEKALAAAIVALKASPNLPQRLRRLTAESLDRIDLGPIDIIVPVPLAKQRHIERGFNQADLIARELARLIKVPVDNFSLARKRHTPIHRIGMDQRARELTVEGAFHVVRPKLVDGKRILLVDDVLTSGATASACARVLKKSGASRVNVFTLARAVMH